MEFPKWVVVGWRAKSKIRSSEQKVRYKALRNSSSNFTKREKVREYIFKRDGYKCVFCGSTENLTIDHKISVSLASEKPEFIELLNTESNLQTACNRCNAAKSPNKIL